MQKYIVVCHYKNEDAESVKKVLRNDLFDYAATQAIHDGQRKTPISKIEFKTLVTGFIETKKQLAIDELKKTLNVAEKMINAKQAEADFGVKNESNTESKQLANSSAQQFGEGKEKLPLSQTKSKYRLLAGLYCLVFRCDRGRNFL